ncbi:flavin reductase family protein [Lentisphaerota bacterium WC36G]|nr:flavin reductase family protein [Lentisphaerae bacterium WC36]
MNLENIAYENFSTNVFSDLNKNWMLLTVGDKKKFNTMTVSWGMFGTFWHKPMVMIGVRPQRYTYDFIENNDTFTLSGFPEGFKEQLTFCGRNSGREVDKIAETNLTPIIADEVDCVTFKEAELIIECRIVYCESLKGKNFKNKRIKPDLYPNRDFHKLYYAEVVNISGVDKYLNTKDQD